MAIYDPSPFLTSSDRRLIHLLGQLVLQSEGVAEFTNCDADSVELSNSEAAELLELLEQFVESRRFRETAFLIENLFSGKGFDSRELRDTYLSWRKFHGKSRALATDQWELFLSRLGIAPRHYGDTPWYRRDAQPMTFEYFLRMERKLTVVTGLSPRVQQLITSYVRLQFQYLNEVRSERKIVEKGQIERKPKDILGLLRRDKNSKIGIAPISTTKIAATMTIVMDLSVAYTTRDWSVASVMSTLAGAAPPAILD